MRFAGIDIASETHVVAGVDERGEVTLKATAFGEDAAGNIEPKPHVYALVNLSSKTPSP